ncbi:MAG: hypothetical protein JW889_15600 [Verrucomicrobia bacterium]|nr:hypothetical protein [Verrucomicrobiota bacterium]
MRMRAFTRDAVFVVGLCNIVAGALIFFLFAQILDLFRIEADVQALTPVVRVAALFLFVFGVGYLFASSNVVGNHLMLFVGLLQNAGIVGIVVWYWLYEPGQIPYACLLPAGLSALFALVFLITWPGALVEARLQRRRTHLVKVAPSRPAAPPPTREPAAEPEPEPAGIEEGTFPSEEVRPDKEASTAATVEPEPLELEPGATEIAPPEEPAGPPPDVPPLRPLAYRDRSGADAENTPDAPK